MIKTEEAACTYKDRGMHHGYSVVNGISERKQQLSNGNRQVIGSKVHPASRLSIEQTLRLCRKTVVRGSEISSQSSVKF